MKKVKIFFIFLSFLVFACRTNDLEVVELFLKDLKEQNISNLELIDKYFEFTENFEGEEKKEVLNLIDQHLEILKEKINTDCQQIKVLKQDDNDDFILDYNLNYDGSGTVFYLICEQKVLTPILIEKGRIRSITSYSKTKDGKKSMLMF